jgi:deoxycytidylate deaminase
MRKKQKQLILGLTGPFGSGCSTLAKVLKDDYGFDTFCLSDFVKDKWLEEHPGKKIDDAPREDLQDVGNRLRSKRGHHVLAQMACAEARKEGRFGSPRLVFDSIRNPAEIEYFRKTFPNFFLVAVDCVGQDRWMRVQTRYNGDYNAFKESDRRDKNEEGLPYGQQVALCVDDADILINNDNDSMVRTEIAWKERLGGKIRPYITLLSGETIGRPTEEETYMSMAYCASLISECFKRQVGAVVVDETGDVISVGYNENPPPLKPCNREFFDCFREMYIDELMADLKYCPLCGKKLKGFIYPYECPACKENIYRSIVRDRAMSRCSALHAEERAIMNAGSKNLRNSKMYVTTFPCFNCARKILEAGIRAVWYVESYPDKDSLDVFDRAGTVILQKFEGVKARAYFRLFPQWRIREEERMLGRRKNTKQSKSVKK